MRVPARTTPMDVVTRGKTLDHPAHPVRMKDRQRQAGLLAPGSPRSTAFPDAGIQWRDGRTLAGHSCGGSPGSRIAPLPDSLLIPSLGTCRAASLTGAARWGQACRGQDTGRFSPHRHPGESRGPDAHRAASIEMLRVWVLFHARAFTRLPWGRPIPGNPAVRAGSGPTAGGSHARRRRRRASDRRCGGRPRGRSA